MQVISRIGIVKVWPRCQPDNCRKASVREMPPVPKAAHLWSFYASAPNHRCPNRGSDREGRRSIQRCSERGDATAESWANLELTPCGSATTLRFTVSRSTFFSVPGLACSSINADFCVQYRILQRFPKFTFFPSHHSGFL